MFIDRFGRKMFENDPDVTTGSSVFDDETHDDDEEINESKVERINDKGDEVPEKCYKCGSHIGLYLKGEPVWLCSNKKCGKYFGTAPCNVQEATTDNKNKMIPVTDFKFDKVYYGDPIKRTNYMTCDENRPLFTTPYPGLASIFSGRYNLIKILREKGCRRYNLNYDEWGLDLSELKEPLSEVHVRVEGYPNLESFTCTFEGYIHTIDVSNIKHNLYQYPWMSDGREVLIANMKEIPIEKVEKVKVTYIVSGAESRNTFQEGVLNDLKNGVNPYSTKRVFHVSRQGHLDGQVFRPRVPEYLDRYDPNYPNFEDVSNPRVCFSPSIEGCLNAIVINVERWKADRFDKLYVYVPEKPIDQYKHTTNKQIIKDKKVYDANLTGEVWIEEPVRLKMYGVIKVDQISNVKKKSTVPMLNGKKGERNYYSYKWHWLIKPKVLDKVPYDYSPTAVCEDMVRDLEKYNYGIPVNGKVQNVQSSEYFNKHYKLLSPDEFEKYGGGICWDYVEFMEGYLDAYGYSCKKYYISTDTKDGDTHTFIIVDDGKGGLLYPESSFKLLEGLHKVKSVEEAIKMITSKMFEMNNNSKKYSKIKYYVWEYTGHPEYGSNSRQCTEYFSKGEPFYEGIAKNDKYVKEGYRMSSYPSRFETYEEVVQEGMFDAGFHSLRFRLAKELGERFKVSNIMRAMGGANDKFVVSLTDDDSKRADVVNTGTGVKVPGIFNNMSLSGAFRRLVEFFQSPEFLTEYVSPVDENEYVMESDDDTSPDRMTVDDGDSIDLNVDINIDDFGSDIGSVQNDYDPKEVEELNKLIASEASAMGEYLNASKNTNVDVLRRLYADIGDEERFHTEQLLFAKASITGEPYEPRDPEVKKEYEELLAMGMDEETALNTAIDKRNMISSDEGPDIEELDDDIVTTESAINQCIAAIDLMDIIFESTDVYSSETVDRCVGIFAEAFSESSIGEEFFSEAVLDPNEYKTPNPLVLIFRGWISLCKFIKQLVKNITIFVNKIMQKQAVRNAWVNEHGIAALFKSGVSLYFYEEKYKNNVSGEPLLYAEFLLYLTRMIASTINCGINCDNIHNGLIEGLRAAGLQPIRVNSIEEGLDKISRITLTKTKVVVDKHNQNELIALFIGNARHGGETIYDMMVKVSKIVDNVANYENEFIKWMKDVQGIQDSVYYTNRDGYNTAMSQIKVVNKGFGIFVKALAHDLKVLSEINKRMLEPQKPAVK